MSESTARVESLEALTGFQKVLWKFQTDANAALGDAESELRRTLLWLELEQDSFWKDQIRKRQTAVERAKEAVRMKTLFKDHSGRPQSAVEEQKELQRALARLAEAEQKNANVRRWVLSLQKEIELYKGSVQRLATSVESLVPAGIAHLDRLVADLQAYSAVTTEVSSGGPAAVESAAASGGGGMARGTPSDQADAGENRIPCPDIPTIDQRDNAPNIDTFQCSLPILDEAHLSALKAVPCERNAPDPEMKITIRHASGTAKELILVHVKPGSPSDSGWCIVPRGSSSGPWESIAVGDLVRMRPDWRDLLKLPVGFSVILDVRGGVEVKDLEERDAGQH